MSAPSDSPGTVANEHARARAAAAWPEHQAGGEPPVNATPTCADVVHAPPILPLPASAWSRHHHPFRAPLLSCHVVFARWFSFRWHSKVDVPSFQRIFAVDNFAPEFS